MSESRNDLVTQYCNDSGISFILTPVRDHRAIDFVERSIQAIKHKLGTEKLDKKLGLVKNLEKKLEEKIDEKLEKKSWTGLTKNIFPFYENFHNPIVPAFPHSQRFNIAQNTRRPTKTSKSEKFVFGKS